MKLLFRVIIICLFSHSISAANFINSRSIGLIRRHYCDSKRVFTIHNKLEQLAKNPTLMRSLATHHREYILKDKSPILPSDISRCDNTSYAILQANLFEHSYIKRFDLRELEEELQGPEESTFLVTIYGSPFTDKNGNTSIFQGHSFNLIKTIEKNEEPIFILAHSFVEKYTLAEFLERQEKYFYSFTSLKKEILIPLYSLLNKKGPWTKNDCEDFFSLTSIYPDHLLGFFPDIKINYSGALLSHTTFARSTHSNIHNSYFLIQFSDGKLIGTSETDLTLPNKTQYTLQTDDELKDTCSSICKKINALINDHVATKAYTKAYRFLVLNNFHLFSNKIDDRNTSYAIVQLNIFNQSYFKKIKSEDLKDELKNSEHGTFLIEIPDNQFNTESLIIIKIVKQERFAYLLFQNNEAKYFPDFDSLEKDVLSSIDASQEIDIGRSTDSKTEQAFSLSITAITN